MATTLLDYFLQPAEAGGVAEVHIVFTRYVSMVSQVPEVRRMLPLKVVDVAGAGELDEAGNEALEKELAEKHGSSMPLYEFEPGPSEVLDALLTRYMGSRIRNALLQSAASELASRQQAMHTATDNAEDLIITYTRLANARARATSPRRSQRSSRVPTPWGPSRPRSPDVVETPHRLTSPSRTPSQLWKIRKNAHG